MAQRVGRDAVDGITRCSIYGRVGEEGIAVDPANITSQLWMHKIDNTYIMNKFLHFSN